jgi:hypothetical protein
MIVEEKNSKIGLKEKNSIHMAMPSTDNNDDDDDDMEAGLYMPLKLLRNRLLWGIISKGLILSPARF